MIHGHRRPPRPGGRRGRLPGARRRRSAGRRAGSFGHGAFSLYAHEEHDDRRGRPRHHDDDALADWLRLYRNQGMRERYHHEILGYNFRMTDIGRGDRPVPVRQARAATRPGARPLPPGTTQAFADLPVRTAGHARGPDPRLPPVHDRRRDRRDRSWRTCRRRDRCRHLLPDPGPSPARTSWSAASTRTCRSPTGGRADAVPADVPGPRRRGAARSSTRSGPRSQAAGRGATPGPVTRRRRRASRDRRVVARSGTREVRIGLIGLGSMGRNHLRVLGALPGVRLAAVADPDPGALEPPRLAVRRPGVRRAAGHARRGGPRRASSSRPRPPRTSALALAALERGIAGPHRKAARRDGRGGRSRSSRRIRGAGRRRSRSATSSGSTRPSSSSGGCSRPAGSSPSTRSRAAAPARSRRASATSA